MFVDTFLLKGGLNQMILRRRFRPGFVFEVEKWFAAVHYCGYFFVGYFGISFCEAYCVFKDLFSDGGVKFFDVHLDEGAFLFVVDWREPFYDFWGVFPLFDFKLLAEVGIDSIEYWFGYFAQVAFTRINESAWVILMKVIFVVFERLYYT